MSITNKYRPTKQIKTTLDLLFYDYLPSKVLEYLRSRPFILQIAVAYTVCWLQIWSFCSRKMNFAVSSRLLKDLLTSDIFARVFSLSNLFTLHLII